MSDNSLCPCQSGQLYEQCCKPYHARTINAPSALELMRSRYCAYVLGEVDYLIFTTHRNHPDYRKNTAHWKMQLKTYCSGLTGIGLEILDFQPGEAESTVTFEARLSLKGSPLIIKEKSRFLKVGERWLYHSGKMV